MEEVRIDDVVQMRKVHPCGSDRWTVTRIGADIKIRCNGCGRLVMMDRDTFLKRRKKLITQGPVPALPEDVMNALLHPVPDQAGSENL